jgi:integrase/recombinase XerC
VSALEISQLAQDIKTNVTPRRNARGQGAAEHLSGALRCMYNHAVADRILSQAEKPAARVPKPRRSPSARMALPDSRLSEITAVAASTGNDPRLDSLIIRLQMETACRRGDALSLTPADPEQCLTRLHEKGDTERWQPVSPTLMAHLLSHAETRGGLESQSACSATRPASRSHPAGTTTSGTASARTCHGSRPSR